MKKLMIMKLVLVAAAFAHPPIKPVSISGTVWDDPYPAKRMSSVIKDVKVGLWQQSPVIMAAPQSIITPPYPIWQIIDSTLTDGQGGFVFAAVTAGPVGLTFDHPSYTSRGIAFTALADTALKNILITPAGAHSRLTGTVWAACSGILGMPCILLPVPNCTVTVVKQEAFPFRISAAAAPLTSKTYTAVTNADGAYALDSIPVAVNGEKVSVSTAAKGFLTQTGDTAIRNQTTVTMNFTLLNSSGSKDTVYVTPANPTTRDSLHFRLFNALRCCATVFRDHSVSITDTVIYLTCSYDDSKCGSVSCYAPGANTNFSCKPLPAGRYTIFEAEYVYCAPGQICPLGVIAPQKVGAVTVSATTAVCTPKMPQTAIPENRLVAAGSRVWTALGRSSMVSLRAFDLRGSLIAEIFRGVLPAGNHGFSMHGMAGKTAANETIVLRLSVNNVTTSSQRIMALQ